MAAADRIPTTVALRQVGDRVRWRVTMSPATPVTGWALELEVCDYNPAAPWPPAVTVEDEDLGIFHWTWDTAGWPPGAYHFRAKRTDPDPGVVSHLYLILQGC
jgi:hypothetical protein